MLVLLVSGPGCSDRYGARGDVDGHQRCVKGWQGSGIESPLIQIRRWRDGRVPVQQELMDMPGFVGHRGDHHEEFLRAGEGKRGRDWYGEDCACARSCGKWTAVIGTVWDGNAEASGRLSSMTSFWPAVKMESGETFEADVIVAADG